MMPIADISGQVFGNWTVVDLHHKRAKSGKLLWNTVCKCGRKGVVQGAALKRGESKSCGCLPRKFKTKRERIWGDKI